MQAGKKMFSDGDLVKIGWTKTMENLGLLIASVVVAGLVVYLVPLIIIFIGVRTDYPGFFAFLALVIAFLLSALIGVGFTRIMLHIVDKKEAAVGDLFKGMDLVLPYLGVLVLYTLIVFVGTLLFIVPGIIWSLKYMFAPILVVDKGMSPVEAIKASGELTMGIKWDLFGFVQVLSVIVTIGLYALGVGLVIAIPVSAIATLMLYRHLVPAGKGSVKMK